MAAGRPPQQRDLDRLVCTECGTVTEDGLGWRAYLVGVDDELDDEEEVAVYCPECAAREFGLE